MAARSTTSEYYPIPYGKLARPAGQFHNVGRYAAVRAASSAGLQKRRNMSTAPLGRTGNELTGYSGTLVVLGAAAVVVG